MNNPTEPTWTKEPWKADNYGGYTDYNPKDKRTFGYGCDNTFVFNIDDGEYHEYYNEAEGIANAQRIVDCVNACKDIPNPTEAIPAMVEALEYYANICKVSTDNKLWISGQAEQIDFNIAKQTLSAVKEVK